MRMWMTKPSGMCDKHLLGEHVELHMFLGSMRRGTSMRGFLDNNMLEPLSIYYRHAEIAREMEARGMKHKSPMTKDEADKGVGMLVDGDRLWTTIDHVAAREELHRRCPQCRAGVRR